MKEVKENDNTIFFTKESSHMTSDTEMEFDVERIRTLTFAKIHEQTDKRRVKMMKKIHMRILIAAALTVVISGTVWAANHYGFFSNLFDNAEILKNTEILAVGDFAENEDVKITVEQMVSDGYYHTMVVSAEAKTEKARKILQEDTFQTYVDVSEKSKDFVSYGCGSSDRYKEENKKYHEVRCISDTQWNGKEITLICTWEKSDAQEALIEPLKIMVMQQKTLEGEKSFIFPQESPIEEIRINAISAYMKTAKESDNTPQSVTLVFRDGLEELLYDEIEPRERDGSLKKDLVAEMTRKYDEMTDQWQEYMGFSHIIKPEDVIGVRVNGVLYPFAE